MRDVLILLSPTSNTLVRALYKRLSLIVIAIEHSSQAPALITQILSKLRRHRSDKDVLIPLMTFFLVNTGITGNTLEHLTHQALPLDCIVVGKYLVWHCLC